MWSVGRYDLGLTEAEFWKQTYRTFLALCERRKLVQSAADHRAGMLAALLVNLWTAHDDGKFAAPADFFPSLMPGRLIPAAPPVGDARNGAEVGSGEAVEWAASIEEIDMGPGYDPLALLGAAVRITDLLHGTVSERVRAILPTAGQSPA